MDNLTYRRYLEDPATREELDQEVRRLRQQAVDDYIVAPIKRAWQRLRMRRPAPARNAPGLVLTRTAAIHATVQRGDTLCIDDAHGYDISASSGCLWITQQDDTADHMIGPNEVFRVSRNGRTLVHAFRQASVHIAYRAEPARRRAPAHGPAYHVLGADVVPAA